VVAAVADTVVVAADMAAIATDSAPRRVSSCQCANVD